MGEDSAASLTSDAERIILLPATLSGLGSRTDVVTYYNIANTLGIALLVALMFGFQNPFILFCNFSLSSFAL